MKRSRGRLSAFGVGPWALGSGLWASGVRGSVFGETNQLRFRLGSEDLGDASLPQPLRVEWRIQSVGAQPRRWVDAAGSVDERRGEPGRRVHRKVERDQPRRGHLVVLERHTRRVGASDVYPGGSEPRSRRRQAKWLPAKIVGRDQQRPHPTIVRKRITL